MKFLERILITFFISILFLGISFADSSFLDKLNTFDNYLENKMLNIQKIAEKYELEKSKKIQTNIKNTSDLIKIIKVFKSKDLDSEQEYLIIDSLKNKINILNNDIKDSLETKITEYEENLKIKKKYYKSVSYKLEEALQKIIKSVYDKKIKNKDLTEKEKKLANILVNLKSRIVKLENFRKMNFESSKSMKIVFISILQDMKTDLADLKNNL